MTSCNKGKVHRNRTAMGAYSVKNSWVSSSRAEWTAWRVFYFVQMSVINSWERMENMVNRGNKEAICNFFVQEGNRWLAVKTSFWQSSHKLVLLENWRLIFFSSNVLKFHTDIQTTQGYSKWSPPKTIHRLENVSDNYLGNSENPGGHCNQS